MKKYATVKELLADYREMEQKAKEVNMAKLSDEDAAFLNEYAELTDFLNDTREALDFVKASTVVVLPNAENLDTLECRSILTDKEQYAELAAALSDNFNKDFLDAVEATRTEPISNEYMGRQEFLGSAKAPLEMTEIKEVVEEKTVEEKTVEEIIKAQEQAKELMEQNEIERDNIIESTLAAVFVLNEAEKLTTLAKQEDEIPVEKPVEIVESNDGYVMASSEVTPENEAEFNSKVNQVNNEVIHNEPPKETTVDRSRVGGNVKLETAEDLGTRDIQAIEAGADLGYLNEVYENSKYDETPDEEREDDEYDI